MTSKFGIQTCRAVLDSLEGAPGDEDLVIQACIELFRSEQIHDVADAIEHWRQRREVTMRRMLACIHRDIMREAEIHGFLESSGDENDTKH